MYIQPTARSSLVTVKQVTQSSHRAERKEGFFETVAVSIVTQDPTKRPLTVGRVEVNFFASVAA